jgi:DNA-binding LacI/PurR family transcriptional regulator
MATIKEVAQRAGVSTATVSRVLNRSGYISADSIRRVQAAMQELDYLPNHAARSLRRQRSERICLVIPQLGTPIYDEIMQRLQSQASEVGYSVIISVGDTLERERQILQQLRRGLADGVAFSYPHPELAEEIARLAQSGVAVAVRSDEIAGAGFDIIRSNEAEMVAAGVRHCAGQGRKRIAFMGKAADSSIHRYRMAACLQALEQLGQPPDEDLLVRDCGSTREEYYRHGRALMGLPRPPDAVICGTDPTALCAIRAAQDAGLRVPQDVAVVGRGNIAEGRISSPALTTIGSADENLGLFGELLFSRLSSPQPLPGRTIFDTLELILRGSA